MKEILKVQEIQISDKKLGINGRDIHKFLGSKQEYAHWIKNRIEKYGFEEKIDFLISLSKSSGGRPKIEYYFTLEATKEITMVEDNEKGKQVRRYFIDVESRFKKLSEHQKLKTIATQKRNVFTDALKSHGVNKKHEYIQLTVQMKEPLGIVKGKKKKDYGSFELRKTMVAEELASLNMDIEDAQGYAECKPICVDACHVIDNATRKKLAS